jgi:hypothetical protein
VRAFYTDRFVLPLPEGHRFPMVKYRRVRERCLDEGILSPADLEEPPAAGWDELALAHDAESLAAVRDGVLSPLAQRRIGFPWSPEMVERSRRSTGATVAAARVALAERAEHGWGRDLESMDLPAGYGPVPRGAYLDLASGARQVHLLAVRPLSPVTTLLASILGSAPSGLL